MTSCGPAPAPLSTAATMPGMVGSMGGGDTATAAAHADMTNMPTSTTTAGGPPGKTEAGGPPMKTPVQGGGGAADGAAALGSDQLKSMLTALVQALSALTQALTAMQAQTQVAGASGGGPEQAPMKQVGGASGGGDTPPMKEVGGVNGGGAPMKQVGGVHGGGQMPPMKM